MHVRLQLALLLVLASVIAVAGDVRPFRTELRPRVIRATDIVFRLLPAAPTLAEQCTGTLSGTRGEVVTVTRASSAYCTKSDGSMALLGNSTPRVEAAGLLVEPSATNLALRSEELNVNWSLDANVTVTANQYADPAGGTSLDRVTKTAAASTAKAYQSIGSVTAGNSVTVSAFVRADTGTAVEGVAILCAGAASNCACKVSSGTCTAAVVSANNCEAHSTVGTSPVRLSVSTTCGATGTTYAAVMPGIFGTDTSGTGGFGFIQAESGGIATSYIPTAGTSVVRQADAPSVAIAAPSTSSGVSIAATYVMGGSHGSGQAVLDYGIDNNSRLQMSNNFGNSASCTFISPGGNVAQNVTGAVDTASVREVCRWNGSNGVTTEYTGGVTASTTGTATNFTPSTLTLGKFLAFAPSGPPIRLMNVCVGKSQGACQ